MRRTGALDKALDERARLVRSYNVSKRAELMQLRADSVYGNRLWDFIQTLNHFKITDADRMLDYVESECAKWLNGAPDNIRYAALRACDDRIMRVREGAGMPPLDDPLPGDDDDVFRVVKGMIGI